MKLLTLTLCAVALALAAPLSHAHGYEAGSLYIGHPWARPTVAGQKTGGGYLKLDNRGAQEDRLLGASAEGVAGSVEMHSMSMEGDVMRMRKLQDVALPAGAAVAFEPGGYHLMLMELKAPLLVGSKFPLKLKFQRAGEVTVQVKVEPPKPASAASASAHQH